MFHVHVLQSVVINDVTKDNKYIFIVFSCDLLKQKSAVFLIFCLCAHMYYLPRNIPFSWVTYILVIQIHMMIIYIYIYISFILNHPNFYIFSIYIFCSYYFYIKICCIFLNSSVQKVLCFGLHTLIVVTMFVLPIVTFVTTNIRGTFL